METRLFYLEKGEEGEASAKRLLQFNTFFINLHIQNRIDD